MNVAASAGALLERNEELARIESALADARTGRGRFVVVEGPAGIGKTALLAAARTAAAEGGMRVLRSRATELETRLRLRSGASAVRAAAGRGIGARACRSAASRCRRGGRPARASGRTACGSARPRRASIPRSRSSTASTGCARTWPPSARSAWCVDDAHWADAASLRYLAFLLTRLEELDAALVVATRPREAGTDAELLARRLTTDPSADVIRLAPLTRAAVAQLVGGEARSRLRIRSSSTPACAQREGRRSWCASS